MLQLFKTNNPTIALILGLILIVGFRVAFWQEEIDTQVWTVQTPPLSQLLYYLIGEKWMATKWLNLSLSGLFVFIQAFWVNAIFNHHKYFGKPTFLPAWIYIVASHLFPSFVIFSPALIALSCYILIFHTISKLVDAKSIVAPIFNLGLLASISFLIYYPAVGIVIYLLISLLLLNTLSARNILSFIIALSIPFVYVVFYFFMTDQFPSGILAVFDNFSFNRFTLPPTLSWKNIIGIVIPLGFAILSIFASTQYIQRSTKNIREISSLLFAFAFTLIIGLLFQSSNSINHLVVFIFPFCIFFSLFIHNIKNKKIAELTHLTVFLCVIFNFTFLMFFL